MHKRTPLLLSLPLFPALISAQNDPPNPTITSADGSTTCLSYHSTSICLNPTRTRSPEDRRPRPDDPDDSDDIPSISNDNDDNAEINSADLRLLSSLSSFSSLHATDTELSSITAFLATQTAIPARRILREGESYAQALATGDTAASPPLITALPSDLQSYAQGYYSSYAALYVSNLGTSQISENAAVIQSVSSRRASRSNARATDTGGVGGSTGMLNPSGGPSASGTGSGSGGNVTASASGPGGNGATTQPASSPSAPVVGADQGSGAGRSVGGVGMGWCVGALVGVVGFAGGMVWL